MSLEPLPVGDPTRALLRELDDRIATLERRRYAVGAVVGEQGPPGPEGAASTVPGPAGATGPAGPAGVVLPGAWQTCPGGANWVAPDPYNQARMRKDSSGTVWLEGWFKNVAAYGFGGANINFMQLPAGFRPYSPHYRVGVVIDPTYGPKGLFIQINADGLGYIGDAGIAPITGGINSVVSVDGISFLGY